MNKKFSLTTLLLIFLSTMIMASIITIISLKRYIKLSDLLDDFLYGIPFYIYLFIIFIIFSITFSIFMYYGLRKEQQFIVKKLQWIIMGNYQHPIFKEKSTQQLSSHLMIINEQINKINEQLLDTTTNLQNFSKNYAPINEQERIEIITSEKNRIARELHDSVSQQLYAANMMISALLVTIDQAENDEKNQSSDTAPINALKHQISLISTIIAEAQNELRALLLHLRPVILENKTLAKGIEYLLEDLKLKTHIDITYDIHEVILTKNIEDQLFRILQELISNVLRHAKATHLEIYLQQVEGHTILRIFDNGIGFNTSKVNQGSYGLNNIKERITNIGGTLNITSLINQGTSVDIRI